jgi:hypothetical protein
MFTNYKESPVQIETKFLSIDEMKTYIYLIMNDINGELKEDLESSFIYQIIEKRIDVYGLSDKISQEVIPFISLFSDGNPGKAIVILIDILNLSETLQRQIVKSDIGLEIYQDGCYTEETFEQLIDLCKNREVRFSNIY